MDPELYGQQHISLQKLWRPCKCHIVSSAKTKTKHNKQLSTRILYREKISFKNEEGIKTCSVGGKARVFTINKPTLKEGLKILGC